MPRLPEFDRGQVLDSALQVIWQNGYGSSSIQKLLDAMGINRGSMYSAFSDKESLFREVMRLYAEGIAELVSRTLERIDDPVEAIRCFFYEAFLSDSADTLSQGCLLFNAVTELSHVEPKLAREAVHHLQPVKTMLIKRLEEAQARGEISDTKAPRMLTDYLITLLAGLRVQCKMNASREDLKAIIDMGLACLKE